MRDLVVIPIVPGEKRPLEKDWQFNTAPMSQASARWPGVARWGAPAGPVNGHWVYDEDVKSNGPAQTADLERVHGPLPRTLAVRSPSGGRHLWFRWRDDRPVRTWTARLPGIDTRGPGGQSLIPPSQGYTWENPDMEPAEAPEWLYTALRVNAPLPEAEAAVARPAGLHVDLAGAVHDARTWPPAIETQNGSGTLFGLALRLVRGRGLSNAAAVKVIMEEYNDRCTPPWSRGEVVHKVEDAALKGQVPWGYTFYQGGAGAVLLRALRRYGPPGHLDACVPYLVFPDGTMQKRDAHDGLANAVVHIANAMGETVSVKETWQSVSWWRVHCEPEALFPTPLALNDEPGPSLVRLQVAPGPTPAWDEFLARLSCADTFLAWVWMITLPKVTRQVLWISGDGQDGKTVVSNTLAAMFGQAATTCTDDYLENSSRWLGSQIYGRRLVVVDDTKMRQVLRRGIVHRITGGSGMKMEAKGVDGFDFIPNCAVLCTSNYTPHIGRGRADRTRLLPLTVRGEERVSDSRWEERLKEELPALLARAREAYGRLAAGTEEPQLRRTPVVEEALRVAAGVDTVNYLARLEKVGLCLDPAKSIAGNELFNRLQTHGGKNAEWDDMKEWLAEQGVRSTHTKTGTVWFGIGSAT